MKKYEQPTLKYYVGENADVLNSSIDAIPQDLGNNDWGCEDVL